MKFINNNCNLMFVFLVFSTNVSAGMNGVVLSQPKKSIPAIKTSKSQTNATTNAINDSSNLTQMNIDYANFINITKLNETIDWAGGKLTRTSVGATFVDSSGNTVSMPELNPDFNALASANDSIAKQWASQYGFRVRVPITTVAVTPTTAIAVTPSSSKIIATKGTPQTPDSSNAQVDSLVKFFYSLENQLVAIRNKAREIRASIANDSAVKGDVDCNNSSKLPESMKANCDQLLKLNTAHAEVMKQVDQVNNLVSSYGKEDMSHVRAKLDTVPWISSAIVSKKTDGERKECGGAGISRSIADTQVLIAPETDLDPKVRAQMESDYKNTFTNTAVGQTIIDPGVGTFTKQSDGTLSYTPADIQTSTLASLTIGPASTFDYIANSAPLIAKKWKAQYGYTPGLWCYEDPSAGFTKKELPPPAPYDPSKSAASQLIPIYRAVYGRSPTSAELSFGVDCLIGGKWTTQKYQDWLYGNGRGLNGGPLGGGGPQF